MQDYPHENVKQHPTFQNIRQIADIDTDAELYTLTLNTRYAQLAAISTSSVTWNWYIDASTTNSGIVLELSTPSKQEILKGLKSREEARKEPGISSREEGRTDSRTEEARLHSSNDKVRINSSKDGARTDSSSNSNQHFRFQKARKDSSIESQHSNSSLSPIPSTIFSTITLQPKETFEIVREEEKDDGVMTHHSIVFPVIISSLPFHRYDARVRKEANKGLEDAFIIKMRYVRAELQKILAMFPPEHIYIEGSFVQPKFLHSSAITLKLHGFLVAELMDYGITYIPPKKIKKLVTDSGNASKELVQEALVKKYDGKELEELAFLQELDDDFSPHIIPVFSNFDESDALAVWCAKYLLEEK